MKIQKFIILLFLFTIFTDLIGNAQDIHDPIFIDELEPFKQEISFDYELKHPIDWKELNYYLQHPSSTAINEVITYVKHYQKEWELSDWYLYILSKEVVEKMFEDRSQDEITLFLATLLNEMGYSVQLMEVRNHDPISLIIFWQVGDSYNEDRTFTIARKKQILIYPNQKVCDDEFFVNTVTWSPLSNYDNGITLKMYPIIWPKNDKLFLPHLTSNSLEFLFENKKITFNYSYDQNFVKIHATLPEVKFDEWVNLPVSESLLSSLDSFFIPQLSSLSVEKQLTFLMAFCRKGFQYKADGVNDICNIEYSVEEMFKHQIGDCEDLSVLLAFLLKRYLKYPVYILANYNHVVVGIECLFLGKENESIRYKRKRIYFLDPAAEGPSNILSGLKPYYHLSSFRVKAKL